MRQDSVMTLPLAPYAAGVVLAAGMGTRMGADGNKAYLRLAGRSMVAWSLDAMTHVPEIGRTILVFRRRERELAERTARRELGSTAVEFVEGGDTRHGSEFNALRHLASEIEAGSIDVVVIHDAARPLARPDTFREAIAVAREFGGAIPALALPDAVRTAARGFESQTGDGALVRVQTPQAFRAAALLKAYRAANGLGFEGTDTSSCVETFTDVDVRTFAGEERNLKVTYPPDIAVAERLLTNPVASGTE